MIWNKEFNDTPQFRIEQQNVQRNELFLVLRRPYKLVYIITRNAHAVYKIANKHSTGPHRSVYIKSISYNNMD